MCEYDEFSLLIYAGQNTGITVLLLLIFLGTFWAILAP